jgi:hypothetical protein
MFQKFINSFKKFTQDLESEELFTLGSSVGIVFLGFLIYVLWQTRLPEEPTEDETEIAEQIQERNENNDLKNNIHDYTIKDLKEDAMRKEKGIIFSLEESSQFALEYKGVTHAVFNNEENLSIEKWINKKIEEKAPTDATLNKQKEFLDIVIIRDRETPLGMGKEVVIINERQSEELFIPYNDYILSFYYQGEDSEELFNKKAAREKLLNKIE